jgi:hypothetical protein
MGDHWGGNFKPAAISLCLRIHSAPERPGTNSIAEPNPAGSYPKAYSDQSLNNGAHGAVHNQTRKRKGQAEVPFKSKFDSIWLFRKPGRDATSLFYFATPKHGALWHLQVTSQ